MDELVVVVATMAQVSVTQAEKGVELAEATQQLWTLAAWLIEV
jgi:hypothetical protein